MFGSEYITNTALNLIRFTIASPSFNEENAHEVQSYQNEYRVGQYYTLNPAIVNRDRYFNGETGEFDIVVSIDLEAHDLYADQACHGLYATPGPIVTEKSVYCAFFRDGNCKDMMDDFRLVQERGAWEETLEVGKAREEMWYKGPEIRSYLCVKRY